MNITEIITSITILAQYITFNLIIQVLFVSYLIISFCYLVKSKNAISVIFFFFIYTFGIIFILFFISVEYIASIILMVYIGAILLFFVFILFSTDLKKFSNIYNNSSKTKFSNFCFIFFFIVYFYLFQFSMEDSISNFINMQPTQSLMMFKDDKSSIAAISQSLFHWYYIEITITGIILLISLIGSIAFLNSKIKKNKIYVYKKIKKNDLISIIRRNCGFRSNNNFFWLQCSSKFSLFIYSYTSNYWIYYTSTLSSNRNDVRKIWSYYWRNFYYFYYNNGSRRDCSCNFTLYKNNNSFTKALCEAK